MRTFFARLLRSKIFATLVLLSLTFVFLFYREWFRVNQFPFKSWTRTVSADCGIVLTGGPGRIREGLSLVENGSVGKLIITGVNSQSQFVDIFPQWIFYPKSRESQIILEKKSETTYGNAQQSLPLVEALQCRDIVLITSQLHMYRAYRTFKSAFPNSIEIHTQGVISTITDASPFQKSMEVLKSIFYSLWAY